jgi:Uma2 family endonuclease
MRRLTRVRLRQRPVGRPLGYDCILEKKAQEHPPMGSIDVIDKPLTQRQLSERYVALLEDPRYAGLPGKFELTAWGQIIMTPPAEVLHYRVAARLARAFTASLGGEAFQEGAIAIEGHGTPVADVVWCSPEFLARHGGERVLQSAPEICVEVLSPSNSTKEIEEKRSAYLAAGALEVWIVDPVGRTIEFFGPEGRRASSQFVVDLAGLFDA